MTALTSNQSSLGHAGNGSAAPRAVAAALLSRNPAGAKQARACTVARLFSADLDQGGVTPGRQGKTVPDLSAEFAFMAWRS